MFSGINFQNIFYKYFCIQLLAIVLKNKQNSFIDNDYHYHPKNINMWLFKEKNKSQSL